MISGNNKEQMEKKLKDLGEEEEREKQIKQKTRNVTKGLKEILKTASETIDKKVFVNSLSSINIEYIAKVLNNLEVKNQYLSDQEENLKNDREKTRRQKLIIFEEKQKIEQGIQNLKNTIVKIQKAIDESVKQETDKRKKIEQDLDKSIAEIKQKIKVFQEESITLDKENQQMRAKKQELFAKINGLEQQFKKKAEQKDDAVKEDKQKLLSDLKQVEEQVNVATEMSKNFSQIQRQNFDNKMAVYIKTKKFPDFSTSFENSAGTIDKCKQELFKGVQRLNNAIDSIKSSEKTAKQLNEQFLTKFKVQTERQQKINQIKKEKQEIKARILELQKKKKQKQETQ